MSDARLGMGGFDSPTCIMPIDHKIAAQLASAGLYSPWDDMINIEVPDNVLADVRAAQGAIKALNTSLEAMGAGWVVAMVASGLPECGECYDTGIIETEDMDGCHHNYPCIPCSRKGGDQ